MEENLIKTKEILSKEISNQIEEYLEKGGTIEVLPYGMKQEDTVAHLSAHRNLKREAKNK